MHLENLLENLTEEPLPHVNITGIATNSSLVNKGDLFIAIPGYQVDGHDYIAEAVNAGAIAVVGEREMVEVQAPYIKVPNSRLALAKIACKFYRNPSSRKIVIGITGTNGKTTTSFMLKHILKKAGYSCSLFGTVGYEVNGKLLSSSNTTPDALELQKLINLSEDEIVIMEVSSHGISQYRVEGIEFDYCLFTNLDHDHLDYHRDMEEYFSVKSRLFSQLKPDGKAIINTYNSWGQRLADILQRQGQESFLIGEKKHHDLQINFTPTPTVVIEQKERFELTTTIGKHNIFNASMALLTAKKIGCDSQQAIEALSSFPGVPGRFEMFEHPAGAKIVIDYAHTEEAFLYILQTAREQGANRIFHVFGFRGNRDLNKRKGMVNVSQELSDFHVLTMDDLCGVSSKIIEKDLYELNDQGTVILDRTIAIRKTLEKVRDGDWVFITGKGAEEYEQQFELHTNSDVETVKLILSQTSNAKDTV